MTPQSCVSSYYTGVVFANGLYYTNNSTNHQQLPKLDIDIDTQSSYDVRTVIATAIPASMVKNGELVKHPCGHYVQTIPVDPHTGLAAIPYNNAQDYGFFKIDFLHLSLLDNFKNKQEIRDLLKQAPDWSLLTNPDVVPKLFQLHRNQSLLSRVKPKSVEEIADCIALIRPHKRDYIEQYLLDKDKVRPYLYRQADDDKSSFKRAHAISYALTVVLQLHLIKQGRL